ncbi:MAG: U32 family peptidase, partial [Clostridia bacterium]|nr:U32 family peptidase [Clostridia bacterium]
MTELLAPAGSIECAYAAINNGADAIYLGVRAFSARASAENFSEEDLSALLRDAKLLGVKVYLAMNTLVKDEELSTFFDALIKAWNMGV